eukprot:1145995-Pelagomonas_calceolata.AAC.1
MVHWGYPRSDALVWQEYDKAAQENKSDRANTCIATKDTKYCRRRWKVQGVNLLLMVPQISVNGAKINIIEGVAKMQAILLDILIDACPCLVRLLDLKGPSGVGGLGWFRRPPALVCDNCLVLWVADRKYVVGEFTMGARAGVGMPLYELRGAVLDMAERGSRYFSPRAVAVFRGQLKVGIVQGRVSKLSSQDGAHTGRHRTDIGGQGRHIVDGTVRAGWRNPFQIAEQMERSPRQRFKGYRLIAPFSGLQSRRQRACLNKFILEDISSFRRGNTFLKQVITIECDIVVLQSNGCVGYTSQDKVVHS